MPRQRLRTGPPDEAPSGWEARAGDGGHQSGGGIRDRVFALGLCISMPFTEEAGHNAPLNCLTDDHSCRPESRHGRPRHGTIAKRRSVVRLRLRSRALREVNWDPGTHPGRPGQCHAVDRKLGGADNGTALRSDLFCASRRLRERAPTFAKIGSLPCRTPGAALEMHSCLGHGMPTADRYSRRWDADVGFVTGVGALESSIAGEQPQVTLGAADDCQAAGNLCSAVTHPSHPRLDSHHPDSLTVSGSSTEDGAMPDPRLLGLHRPPLGPTIVSRKAVPGNNNLQGVEDVTWKRWRRYISTMAPEPSGTFFCPYPHIPQYLLPVPVSHQQTTTRSPASIGPNNPPSHAPF